MNKPRQVLIAFVLVALSLFGQALPALAGPLSKVVTDSLSMRTYYTTSSGIIMTMAYGEALSGNGGLVSNEGYSWGPYSGWKSSTGSIVSGYAAAFNYGTGTYYTSGVSSATATLALQKYDLGLVRTNIEYPTGTVFRESLSNSSLVTTSDMTFIHVTYVTVPNGAIHQDLGTVHTNFHTTSPSSYYLQF